MIFLQITEVKEKLLETEGLTGVMILLLLMAIVALWLKLNAEQKKKEAIAEKAIEALVMAQKAMDTSTVSQKEQAELIRKLEATVNINSCKWNGS